jgi:hypothetical protein
MDEGHRPATAAPGDREPRTRETDMRLLTPRDPPRDNGYPLDGDLQQMTDDGCPIVAVRSADPNWRDNLGEYDTFADDVGLDLPTDSAVGHAGSSVRVESQPAAVWTPHRSRDGEVTSKH